MSMASSLDLTLRSHSACSESESVRNGAQTPNVFSRVIWAVAGNFSRATTQAGYLIALARLSSLEAAGEYALGLAVTAPLFVFLNLGLRQLQGTENSGEAKLGVYLGLRLVSLVLGNLCAFGLVYWRGYSATSTAIILVLCLYRSVEALADVFHGYFQHRERNDLIARSEVVKSLTSLTSFVAILSITGNVIWAMFAVTGLRLVLIALQELRWTREAQQAIVPSFDPAVLAALCRHAIPLGAVAMCVSLTTNMPRYFLAEHYGEAVVGIYAIMELYLQLVQTVTISIQQATSASMARNFLGGRACLAAHLLKLLSIALLWGAAATLGTYCCGGWLLELCVGKKEAGDCRAAFALLISASLALNSRCFLTATMVVIRRTGFQALLTVAGTLGAYLLGGWLIPPYGLLGAASTVLSAGLLYCLLTAVAIIGYFRQDSEPQKPTESTA